MATVKLDYDKAMKIAKIEKVGSVRNVNVLVDAASEAEAEELRQKFEANWRAEVEARKLQVYLD